MYTIRLGIWHTTYARYRTLKAARLHAAQIMSSFQIEVHIDRAGLPIERWTHGVYYDMRKGGKR